MYLPTLTDDELLHYAGTLTLTPLETELVRRFQEFKDETGDTAAECERLGDENNGLSEKVDELEEKVEQLEEELRERLA